MRIDSLSSSPDRAGKYTVKFSDGSVKRLYRQTVEDFGLYIGRELSQDEFSALIDAAGKMSAKMRAVRIVSASGVSKRELEHRLVSKGENQEDASEAVRWMSELSLLDDSRTAQTIVERCIAKGYGVSRAKQALYEKRIPKELWDAALENYPDQSDRITEFLVSKLDGNFDEKSVRRAVEALMRRGHSYGNIRSALSRLELDLEQYPED